MKIGITGHQERDGIDWSWVRSQIERFIAGKTKVIGYSSLAIGTDQIFAEAIIASGGLLYAVLPLNNYEEYFSKEDIIKFEYLRNLAKIIQLNSHKADSRAFLDAGKWIVRESDCLIAVWDGEPAEGAGGTGDIVAYAQSLSKKVHCIDPIKRLISDL